MPDFPAPEMADVELVDIMKALSDPTRLEIVADLADGEPHPKQGYPAKYDCSKSTMSHHFRTLREAGLTRTVVEGRTHTVQLRREELDRKFPGLIDAITRSRS